MGTGAPHGVFVSIIFRTSITLQNLDKYIRHYVPALNGLEEVDKMSRVRVEAEEIRVNIKVSILLNVVGH